MASKHRKKKVPTQGGRVGLVHGHAWRAMEWYVPFQDDHAIFYHGHQDPDDHSLCGPQIYCCPKAAHLHIQTYPQAECAKAEWEYMHGRDLALWMGEDGPNIYYLFFCDPERWKVIRFVGVAVPEVHDVLLKRVPLDRYLARANAICGIEEWPSDGD